MTLPSACSYTFSKSGGNAASLAHCKRNATRYHVEMNYPQAQDLTSSSGSKIYLIPYKFLLNRPNFFHPHCLLAISSLTSWEGILIWM
mmetsp:Transcript_19575/g.33112  ORF Transcript_19575/g.33112 Transcript_19575/m.33112 type:complete len:88 (-) Transcript_19575:94-357(-)